MTFLLATIMGWLAVAPANHVSDQVVFEGNSAVSRQTLLRALRYYNIDLERDFDITDADDAAFFLREYYFTQGFSEAEVSYQFQRYPLLATFHIQEGKRLWISQIMIEGNTAIPSDRLRSIVTMTIRRETLSPLGRLLYVPSTFEAAQRDIRSVFVQEGFLNVEVDIQEGEPSKNAVPLTVKIHEGMRFQLTKVFISGTDYSQKELWDVLGITLPMAFRPDHTALYRTRLIDFLRQRGYYLAEVSTEITQHSTTGEIQLHLKASPGEKFILSDVQVKGLKRTRKSAVLGKVGLKPGQPYDAAQADEAVRRLWFIGAFSDVEPVVSIVDKNRLQLTLDFTEGRARQIRIFAGYGQWEQGFAEVTYIDRNVLGTLNRFELNGYVSMRGYSFSSTVFNPWFLNQPVTTLLGVFFSKRELPAFEATQYGGVAGFRYRPDARKLTGFQLQYGWRAVTNSQVFGDEKALENYTVGSLTFWEALDKRNSTLIPMQGYLLQHDLSMASRAFLGELSFARATGQMTFYLPLKPITAEQPFIPFMVFNHRAGIMLPYADTKEIPVQERFFLGGPDTVRSFAFDGLGPMDKNGNLLGGQAYLQGNLELQIPVIWSFYWVGFVDIGNLASEAKSMTWDETAIGAGMGLRFYTPIGAVRMDYGYNVIRRPGYPIGAWQFGFGFTF